MPHRDLAMTNGYRRITEQAECALTLAHRAKEGRTYTGCGLLPRTHRIRRHGQSPREGMRMPHVTRLRVVSAAVAAGALTLGTLTVATAAQAGTTRRAIADTHPAWAVAAKRLSSNAV